MEIKTGPELMAHDFVTDPGFDLCDLIDTLQCSAACLFATSHPYDCDCRCEGHYHGEGRAHYVDMLLRVRVVSCIERRKEKRVL